MAVDQLFDLTGRTALITGAAGNLGGVIAATYADAGADLVLIDINETALSGIADRLDRPNQRVMPIVADATDIEQLENVYRVLDAKMGTIDVLANVAGPAALGSPETISVRDIADTLHRLVTSRFFCTQQAGIRMLHAGRGSIINIGSIASVSALGRGHIAYSMGMGAIAQMTRELSTEWSARGVRVNAILPSQIPNADLENRMESDPRLEGAFLHGLPVGRLGERDDIAGIALLLASDAASFITGALIPLDGGNLAMNAGGTHGGMLKETKRESSTGA